MNIGIIGYGSMGKMLLHKFSETGGIDHNNLFVSNRTLSKIEESPDKYVICECFLLIVLNILLRSFIKINVSRRNKK